MTAGYRGAQRELLVRAPEQPLPSAGTRTGISRYEPLIPKMLLGTGYHYTERTYLPRLC